MVPATLVETKLDRQFEKNSRANIVSHGYIVNMLTDNTNVHLAS